MISDGQVELLNKLPKSTPALAHWFIDGSEGFGDIIKGQQDAINSIPGATTPISIGTGADGSTPYLTIPANTSFTLTVSVTEAFGSGATLTIGSVTDHSLVAGVSSIDLTITGNYVIVGQLLSTDTELFTYLDSNSSPTGAVTVIKT